MIMLKEKDLTRLNTLGISKEALDNQLQLFTAGIQPVHLHAAATIGQGIEKLDPQRLNTYINKFFNEKNNITIGRFVPASGAASRMFKAFFQFLENDIDSHEIQLFEHGYQNFAFYDQIKCLRQADFACAIDNMINKIKLADLPKALIPFHRYKDEIRTALEEHLVESAFIIPEEHPVNLHFTISEAHQQKFDELIEAVVKKYSQRYHYKYNINFSYQSHKTDTVAVKPDNSLYRVENGNLLFRPGGHGALIENLNNLDFDIIFIKNIDNVQTDNNKQEAATYKQAMGGYLLMLQEKVKAHLISIAEGRSDLTETMTFITRELHIVLPTSFNDLSEEAKKKFLFNKMNRPIRICGMVKNEGEPGGGPFWVSSSTGEITRQIVESSQINLQDEQQERIFNESTHFNPVDIVCWVKDYQGNKFNLEEYIDPQTAFITEKTHNGEVIKVLEHPGLCNGAMANWITLFVEVPITTFSPVKTITDLLRQQHQT